LAETSHLCNKLLRMMELWDTFTDPSTIEVRHLNIIMFCLKVKHLACWLENCNILVQHSNVYMLKK